MHLHNALNGILNCHDPGMQCVKEVKGRTHWHSIEAVLICGHCEGSGLD